LFGTIADKKSIPTIEVAPARARRMIASASPSRARYDGRTREDIDVNTVSELNKATAMAATGQTRATATPRIKLSPHGFAIDHADPELGERLMTDALGGR
jgi:hypothetical protein